MQPANTRSCHARSGVDVAVECAYLVAPVALKQFAQGVVIGDLGRPAVGLRDGRVQRRVGIREPLRSGVVEVRQGPFLESLRGILIARDRTPWVAGHRLGHPLDPLGRVEPAVAQLGEPAAARATAPARGSAA